MDLLLKNNKSLLDEKVVFTITGSKSESNRLLILKALYPSIKIKNLSNSDDTIHMQQALSSQETTIDIGHAGTAMRFLTAYFSAKRNSTIVLTGSERMQQRPIKVLVDALRSIGARINYLGEEGYPPLQINGGFISKSKLKIDATVSSQYITALMLIAPSLENGLEIELKGDLTSRPYIEMTSRHLESIGVNLSWSKESSATTIKIEPLLHPSTKNLIVESDWSSAGYWYSWVALQPAGYALSLEHYFEDSVQGDSKLKDYYELFGVQTVFKNGLLTLTKTDQKVVQNIELHLINEPDQAQTIFATCLALGINAHFTGLHTLRIKETDRIEALKTVGLRFRESEISTTQDSITLHCKPLKRQPQEVIIDTYNDHRMALAFAPLSYITPLIIKDAGVVTKSYPQYWEDLKAVNVDITEI
ncbi:MAG: 3-phosphoshikimate 1-carboxyvinyltransferase [Nonlabens sp.]|uniref:3-phosphoshikimate 1-carboxyvinyltransferase n=1 Tax=Nonlabens sp. TaxID=1888209 RepID=UPI003EF75302